MAAASRTGGRPGWAHMDAGHDPWEHVEDLDGTEHYRVLELDFSCSDEDVRAAYRRLARVHHPDKGGSPNRFQRLRRAYEVLGDSSSRKAYDMHAGQLKYRYIPGVTQRVDGGEDLLLDEFESLGLKCDPMTQLVVLCEVCGRPSTKECWTCGLKFCDFCTRKQHWKGKWPLHWPMVNTPGKMMAELGKREMEKKRLEDAKVAMLEDPNYRTEADLDHIREFKKAAHAMQRIPFEKRRVTFDMRIAKYYMWAQTPDFVYLVTFVPNGFEDKKLHFEPTSSGLLLQAEDSPPIIDRVLAGYVSSELPIESFCTTDKRFFAAAIPKAEHGGHWKSVFHGDDEGARCIRNPYVLTEMEEEVVMEIELPFWIDKDDCRIDINEHQVSINVRGEKSLRRTFWRDPEQESKRDYQGPVDVNNSVWSLDDEITGNGERIKMLTINLARPPPTENEIKWKKGVRQSNLTKEHRGHHGRRGVRFFDEDADLFELEDMLIALCFMETNAAWVPFKPYERAGNDGNTVRAITMLSENVRGMIDKLLDGAAE